MTGDTQQEPVCLMLHLNIYDKTYRFTLYYGTKKTSLHYIQVGKNTKWKKTTTRVTRRPTPRLQGRAYLQYKLELHMVSGMDGRRRAALWMSIASRRVVTQ